MSTPSKALPNAREIWDMDRRHVLHPFVHFDSFREFGSLIIERGEGAYITDLDGKRYLDAVGGLWCTNIGLGREEMVMAIADQVRKLAFANHFVDMTNAPAARLGARLAELAPGALNHVMFTTGGSTAVDTAVRLIRFYQCCRGKPEKRHMLSRKQAYHGSTYITASLTGKDRLAEFEYKTDTIHLLSCPNPYRAPDGMNEAAFCDFLVREFEDKVRELGPENVSAFFAEPIMGAGGVIVAPADYNKRIYDLCRKYDIVYVADEVVTAFGRVGEWFASSGVFGIEPDIITCAKGLTSGYIPLGAMIYSDKIHDAISLNDPDRFFGHGFTYAGHPVACAAGLKALEIVETENLLDHVKDVGGYFEQRLHELADLPLVGNVRGKRLMMCIEFVADRKTKELFPDALNIGKLVSNKCEEKGLIVRPIVHLNIMSPAFIITRAEVDTIVDTLRNSIKEVADALVRDGTSVR